MDFQPKYDMYMQTIETTFSDQKEESFHETFIIFFF